MTTIMTEELSAEVDDFLAHYGVKGMRWGHRKAEDTSSGGSSGPSRVQKIKKAAGNAVVKIGERDTRIEQARFNVEKRNNEIKGAKRQMKRDTRMLSKERKAGRNDIRNMKLDLLSHPDSATAIRLTSGEMFVQAMFGVPGSIVQREQIANKMERRQATGYYQNKKRK